MKKICIFVLTMFLFFFAYSSAKDCISFSQREVCLSIDNKGGGEYMLERDVNSESGEMLTLNCKILFPNGKLKDLGTCDGEFSYKGNSESTVRFYVYLEGQSKVFEMDYNFLSLTSEQMSDLKAVYDLWPDFIDELKYIYPVLEEENKWQQISSAIYEELGKLINGKSEYIDSYKQFREIIKLYAEYTRNLISG